MNVQSRAASLALLAATGLSPLPLTAAGVAPASLSTATAATWPVTNCNDSGAGSLRAAVASAASGDTIDLTMTGCDRIKLAGQPITIVQDDLSLVGPGRYKMVVDGDYKSSVLRHSGAGTLELSRLSVEHGRHRIYDGDGNAFGGCIHTTGSIDLAWVDVRHCGAYARVSAFGGGIYAEHDITAVGASIHSNTVRGSRYGRFGGGLFSNAGIVSLDRSRVVNNDNTAIYATGLTLRYTTVANNRSQISVAGSVADIRNSNGGGVVNILNSTISRNTAHNGPALLLSGLQEIRIVNSTISNNVNEIGWYTAWLDSQAVSVLNSTIAMNRLSDCEYTEYHSGLNASDSDLLLESTIIANNTSCGGEMPTPAASAGHLSGANNLLTHLDPEQPEDLEDTVTADPRLGPLADNGGMGQTHALMTDSPAIDMGNNAAGLTYDQRGDGYPRTRGAGTDIGAYER